MLLLSDTFLKHLLLLQVYKGCGPRWHIRYKHHNNIDCYADIIASGYIINNIPNVPNRIELNLPKPSS